MEDAFQFNKASINDNVVKGNIPQDLKDLEVKAYLSETKGDPLVLDLSFYNGFDGARLMRRSSLEFFDNLWESADSRLVSGTKNGALEGISELYKKISDKLGKTTKDELIKSVNSFFIDGPRPTYRTIKLEPIDDLPFIYIDLSKINYLADDQIFLLAREFQIPGREYYEKLFLDDSPFGIETFINERSTFESTITNNIRYLLRDDEKTRTN